MAIIATNTGGANFEPVEEGVHMAVCYSIVDIGDVYSEKFKKIDRKILITWELPDVTFEVEGEVKPRAISKEYTLSLADKANLRKDLESWRGKKFTEEELKGFDLKNVSGKPCQIQVIHTAKGTNVYANIAAIMSLPKGVKGSPPFNPIMYFDLESENALEELTKLPTWVQDKVKKSKTYENLMAATTAGITTKTVDGTVTDAEDDDELPF